MKHTLQQGWFFSRVKMQFRRDSVLKNLFVEKGWGSSIDDVMMSMRKSILCGGQSLSDSVSSCCVWVPTSPQQTTHITVGKHSSNSYTNTYYKPCLFKVLLDFFNSKSIYLHSFCPVFYPWLFFIYEKYRGAKLSIREEHTWLILFFSIIVFFYSLQVILFFNLAFCINYYNYNTTFCYNADPNCLFSCFLS